jgi:DNA-binding NarL/FixJ family response regulator
MTIPASTQAETARQRILIVDDHPLLRRGLAAMIDNEPELEVCGQAATRVAGLAAIPVTRPDLITVDISLPDGDGLELIKDLRARFPELPVLVVSMHDESLYAERAFRAGARGYVTKQEMDQTILAAIRCLLRGAQYMSPKLGAWFALQYLAGNRSDSGSLASLSDRELQVFDLLGQHKTRSEIARRLHLSVKTVESHRAHIKQKLNLRSGTELLQRATQWLATGRDA